MPHDPSTCPRCRWMAEREGWEYHAVRKWLPLDHPLYSSPCWVKGKYYSQQSLGHPSFCPSLDAVAGLRQEMAKHGGHWVHFWLHYRAGWGYTDLTHLDRGFEFTSPEGLPAACVIEAAMQVLPGKEKSDEDA